MHVVVGGARHNQQIAFEVLDSAKRRACIVAHGVLLRCEHESFSIDGVIETPVCHRCHCDAGCIRIAGSGHRHQCLISSETPSENAYLRCVDIRQRRHIERRQSGPLSRICLSSYRPPMQTFCPGIPCLDRRHKPQDNPVWRRSRANLCSICFSRAANTVRCTGT